MKEGSKMSIIPFRNLHEEDLSHPNILCLINNNENNGRIDLDAKEFMLTIPLTTDCVGGVLKDMNFPLDDKDSGSPTSILLGEKMMTRFSITNDEDEIAGTLTMSQSEEDPKDRVCIFIQLVPPYDLDGFMWGVEKVCDDCAKCTVVNCESRGSFGGK